MERFKIFYHNHRTWFYNLQYILVSIILMILVSMIDLRIIPIQPYLPGVFLTKVGLAKSILTTMAGALLTITTFTFSTILTVMSAYASNFTPRAVENFVNMKITMKVLGVFIGGFFYCISMLLFMRDSFEEEQVIAGVVAVIYSIICIIYFVIFVQKVLAKFQGVNLVYDIADEAKDVICTELTHRRESTEYQKREDAPMVELRSEHNGYLSVIDYDEIIDDLKDRQGLFIITVRKGDYIIEGQPIAILQLDEPLEEDSKLLTELGKSFYFQDTKISYTDYRYNVTKLVEIILRAMSTGINDPNTAIHVIRKLAVTVAPLASTDSYHISMREAHGVQIFYTSHPFREDMYFIYSQIINSSADDPSVMRAIIESFRIIDGAATEKNHKVIADFAKYAYETAMQNADQDLDRQWITAAYAPFKIEEDKAEEAAAAAAV